MHVDKSFTKIQARVRPPPIQAMPAFWEHLVLQSLPKCVMASLSPCGLLNLTSPTDRSPLGELRLPSTPSMAPAIPLLTRGNKDKLVASLGGDIWIIDIASLNIEFCHDGHRKKSKGNQVIH